MTAVTEPLEGQVARLFACDPDLLADPFPVYRRLRAEAPVLDLGSLVVLSRYDDVRAAFEDQGRLSNIQFRDSTRVQATVAALPEGDRSRFWELFDFEALMVFAMDPPEHGTVRGLLHRAFTPRAVGALRGSIAAMVSSMLDRADRDGEIELMGGLAYELPLYVISDMLGVPVEERPMIRGWSAAIGNFIGNYSDITAAHAALTDWRAYQRELVARQREHSTGNLMASLLAATDGGERLTDEQLDATVIDLLFAGHETTTSTIANGMSTLAEHPAQYASLHDDPTLVAGAVEEILRYCTSVHTIHRVAKEDLRIGGIPVAQGRTVRLLLASANRDEAHFERPEAFDTTRRSPRTLTFGQGIHFCIGAALARFELTAVVEEVARRYRRIELLEPVVKRPNFGLQGPKAVRLGLSR